MPARDIADLMYLINHCQYDNKNGIAGAVMEPPKEIEKKFKMNYIKQHF